jgi:hypothetical protein
MCTLTSAGVGIVCRFAVFVAASKYPSRNFVTGDFVGIVIAAPASQITERLILSLNTRAFLKTGI